MFARVLLVGIVVSLAFVVLALVVVVFWVLLVCLRCR